MELPDVTVFDGKSFDRNTVPTIWVQQLRAYLAEQNMDPSFSYIKKWWRTQSTIYLSRLNNCGHARVCERRMQKKLHGVIRGSWSSKGLSVTKHDLNDNQEIGHRSLPSKTINWHIRRGEKHLREWLLT